MLNITSTM